MWRTCFVVALLVGLGTEASPAQEWRGRAALGVSGGYQTNLYLDPLLGTWTPDVESPFLAITPRVGITREARRTRMDATLRSHIHPQQADRPQLAQSTVRIRRVLASEWTVSGLVGGTRYRYPATDTSPRTVRDSWWALPSLRWTPTSTTMIALRTGLTQRFEQRATLTDRQTSGVVSLRATHWLTDRVQGGARLYYSTGRTSTSETGGFGGAGGTLTATYWPRSSVSIRSTVSVEQFQYEYETTQAAGTVRDRIARAGVTATWRPRSALALFGRARTSAATLDDDGGETDFHLSVGMRLRTERILGGRVSSTPAPHRRVCRSTDEGLRLRVPYDGAGTVHVTGDFNGWSLPGIPLTHTDDGWTARLELAPGQYAYRLRVVDDGGEGRWLSLPSYAQTTESAFGGTNGVCIVQ